MTEQAQDFTTLVSEGKADLSPVSADDARLKQLADNAVPLTIYQVDETETENGPVFNFVFRASDDGRMYTDHMWSNVQRDATLRSLMKNLADGPISGLKYQQQGSGKKTFFVLVPV